MVVISFRRRYDLFLKDKMPYANLLRTLEVFGEYSGLRVNREKTKTLALGGNTLQERKR